MSTEEDLELRDLVTQTLESNGVLSKIRAELRASVFLALEEQDLLQTENSYANKTFKNFIKTSDGMLLTQLVREFLEFFELDFTLSVFDPETSYGKDYEYVGRNTLLKEMKMKNVNGSSGPLLAQILKNASTRNEPDKDSSKEDMDKTITNSDDDDKIIHKKNVKNSQSNIHIEDSSKISADQSICVNKVSDTSERIFTQDNSLQEDAVLLGAGATATASASATTTAAASASSSAEEENGLKPRKEVNQENKKNSLQSGSSLHEEKPISSTSSDLMSLSNLPPLLNTNKSKTDSLAPISNSRRDMNQLNTMINSLEIESNYDEDFQSSASGSAVEGRSGKNSLPGSESEEIEEDIGSGIDDLLSNASGLEDMTVDATVSNASGLGDYMENV